MIGTRPPRWAERLVGRLVSDAEREYFLGDLAEEYDRVVARRGPTIGALWYGAQLGSAILGWARDAIPRWSASVGHAAGSLPTDIRRSVRTLIRTPGYTALCIGVLAVGIAGASAVFSVVKVVLLDPLDLQEPDRLTAFWSGGNWSQAEFDLVRERTRAHRAIAAYSPFSRLALRGVGEPEMLVAASVTGAFFSVLDAAPATGRPFTLDDERAGSERVAVLSHGLWQRRFGGDPNTVGRTITLGDDPYVVVGVMPAEFWFPSREVELWTAEQIQPGASFYRFNHQYHLVGRLAPGVGFELASDDARFLGAALEAEFDYSPNFSKASGAAVTTLKEKLVGDTEAPLAILVGAVSIILIIAYVTVAGLALNRSMGRRGALAIRMALGADRTRLATYLVSESFVLSVGALAAGVVLSAAAVRGLIAILPADTPRVDEIGLEPAAIVPIAGISIVVVGLLSLFPVLRNAGTGALGGIGAGRVDAGERGRATIRRSLVVAETTLSVALVVGAGLLARSLWHLTHTNPGFTTENVLTFELNPPNDYDAASRLQLVDELATRLEQTGARAGAITRLPLRAGWSFSIESTERGREDVPTAVPWRAVTPGLFDALQMRAVRGRVFDRRDATGSAPVAVVNQRLAGMLWPDVDPVGRQVRINLPDREWLTVIGVVEDSRVVGLREDVPPALYQPYAQAAQSNTVAFTVRTTDDPAAIVPIVRSLVRERDPDVVVANLQTMEQLLDAEIAPSRHLFFVVGGFAVFAMLLGALGLAGVVSQTVSSRTREIGIRLALGAFPRTLIVTVIAEGLLLAGMGVAFGVGAAVLLTRGLQQTLYGVGAHDPATLATVVAIQVAVAVVASLGPAVRASRVDPAIVLREE